MAIRLYDNRAKRKTNPKDRCRDGCPVSWPGLREESCAHCQHVRYPGTLIGVHFDDVEGAGREPGPAWEEPMPWDTPLSA